MVVVKICGVRRLEDAMLASEYGADAIGVLVGQKYSSVDFLTADEAARIVSEVPPSCSTFLVTHLGDWQDICSLVAATQVNVVQMHGQTTQKDLIFLKKRLPWLKIYKAVNVLNALSIEDALVFEPLVDGFVLDTYMASTNQVGGTGQTHDWNISAEIVKRLGKPVLLAGGLTAENVKAAIRKVQPFGVDVNTGTIGANGFKDATRMREFIVAAKAASDERVNGRSASHLRAAH